MSEKFNYVGEIVHLRHKFRFESAHFLPNVPEDHKCRRLHGHSCTVEVEVKGPLDEQMGWYVDYSVIKAAIAPVRDQLDHYCLNDIEGLSNPTSEHLAVWIWRRLIQDLPGLHCVAVHETCNNACWYYGPVVASQK